VRLPHFSAKRQDARKRPLRLCLLLGFALLFALVNFASAAKTPVTLKKCHAFTAKNAENGMNGIMESARRRTSANSADDVLADTISLACHNIAAA
jgi:hypothetical protein